MRWWALLVVACVVLAGCAEPGQNGTEIQDPNDGTGPEGNLSDNGTDGDGNTSGYGEVGPRGNTSDEPNGDGAPEGEQATEQGLMRPRAEPCPGGDEANARGSPDGDGEGDGERGRDQGRGPPDDREDGRRCLRERGLVVFDHEDDAQSYRRFRSGHLDPEDAPPANEVEWRNETVIVAAAGQQSSLCPSIHVMNPQHHENVTEVPVVLLDVIAFCPEALSYPTNTTVVDDRGDPIRWSYKEVPAHLVGRDLWNFSSTHLEPLEGQVISGSPSLQLTVEPVKVSRGELTNDTKLSVNVTYTGDYNFSLQGPACGFHVARDSAFTWDAFAHAASRNTTPAEETSTLLRTNSSCEATVGLDNLRTEQRFLHDLEPGTYRATVLGWELAGDRRTALMAWETIHVTE